ncbi:MAG: SGNH/GDSL hydrolase family protein [Bacteroides sp.]|jgi:hypothetical protein|nr:SGNH/GDSL hydrolase family protein [Bacteroides sp.]MCI1682115.1 SGNH/GDSL hydrolase family protein [Bacteroides sp.]
MYAEDTLSVQKSSMQMVYYDAAEFPLLGKAIKDSRPLYSRLPDSLKNKIRPALWNLSQNTAGLSIRFRSNSTRIGAKWEVRLNNSMNHMTATGVKGLDLYCLKDGKWRFVNSGRPTGKQNDAVIIANMEAKEREYMLYLPLYDGIVSLSIGIDSLAEISQPKIQKSYRNKPIAFYGTSILEGGCASRPGMASTNIISRLLNRETINLGFSGNAFLDLEIAEVLGQVDASIYVLDFIPNASVSQIRERTIPFYRIIRKQHPDVPIIFVEDPVFTHAVFDQKIAQEVADKNKALGYIYRVLKEEGETHIFMILSKNMLGTDGEATVDGIHFTDVGFMRYVNLLYPILEGILK